MRGRFVCTLADIIVIMIMNMHKVGSRGSHLAWTGNREESAPTQRTHQQRKVGYRVRFTYVLTSSLIDLDGSWLIDSHTQICVRVITAMKHETSTVEESTIGLCWVASVQS